MAIRDIVTRGFGNGTYDPGVNKLPTRGYSIGAAITAIAGGCWVAGDVMMPEFKAGDRMLSEFKGGEVYHPSFVAGQEKCS